MRTVPTGEVAKRTWFYEGKKRTAYRYSLTVTERDGTWRRYRKQFATRARDAGLVVEAR